MPTEQQIAAYKRLKNKGWTSQQFIDKGIDPAEYETMAPSQNKQAAFDRLVKQGWQDQDFLDHGIDPSLYRTASSQQGGATKSFAKTMKEQIVEDLPEMAGGTALSIAEKSTPWAAILAALGGAGGEAYKQLYQHVAEPEQAPRNSIEALRRMGGAVLRQGGAEAGGRLAIKAVQKAAAPFAKTVSEEGRRAIAFMREKFGKESILPAEATESWWLDRLHNISEQSFFGGATFAKKKLKRATRFENFIERLAGEPVDPDLLGEAFESALKKKAQPFKNAATKIYDKIDDLTKPTPVKEKITEFVKTGLVDAKGNPMTRAVQKTITVNKGGAAIDLRAVKEYAQPLVDIARQSGNLEAANYGDDIAFILATREDFVPFRVAQDLRSKLLSLQRAMKLVDKKSPAIGKAGKGADLVNDAIKEGLAKFDAEQLSGKVGVTPLWEAANKIWRKKEKIFSNKTILSLRRLVEDSPEKVAKQIFRPNATNAVKRVKAVVDEKTWSQMQGWALQDILAKSIPKGETLVNGASMLQNMFGRGGLSRKTMNEVFGETAVKNFDNLATSLKVIQQRQPGGGGMLIQIVQASGLVGLVTFRLSPEFASFLIAPEVIAKMMNNDITARWLTQGVKLPKNSPQAGALAARIIGEAKRIKDRMKSKNTIQARREGEPEPLKASIREMLEAKNAREP